MKVVKLNISGMHCSACSAAIDKNLQKIPSITNIKINSISGLAKIAYDETKITESQIAELITSYGFPSSLDNSKALEIAYIKGLKRRLWVAIPLFIVIFALHMGGFHTAWSGMVQLLLASVVQFYCGLPFYQGARSFFKTKSADMNVLIALGTSVAYVYSVYLFLSGAEGFYFEGSSAVICFVLVGEYLKSSAKKKASDALEILAKLLPAKARLVQDSKEEQWVAIDKIQKGDKCLVVGGEKIPLDGIVLSGKAEVSSAHINGEEVPKTLEAGAEVIGGSLVLNGEIIVEANKDSNAFFVYEMLDLLELSQSQKPPIGALADKIASIFVPSVVLLSLVAFVVWLFVGQGLAFALSIAACVLVVSCPCALGLAVPLAIVCASMRAKKAEILIKNPDIYEKVRKIKTIVFDKTGTLTKGEIVVQEFKILSANQPKDLILGLSYAMQSNNPHPIAKAILGFARDFTAINLESKNYEIGKGVQARFKNTDYFLGSLEWVESQCKKPLQGVSREDCVALGNQEEILALFYLQDSIQINAKATIEALRMRGVESVILSGDNEANVAKVAQDLGVAQYFAGVTPTQKADKIAQLSQSGAVCFVGDGINDALALKEASFGISFIEATELAQEVGDVLLLKNDLWGIVEVFDIANATLKNIRQNLFFAYIYNIILIPLAAGVLYPYFGIVLQPAFAGAAMAASSLSVVTNALRISNLRLKSCA